MADDRTDPQYKVRMPAELHARLKAEAEANKRSMNAEIVARLEESLNLTSAADHTTLDMWLKDGRDKPLSVLLFEIKRQAQEHLSSTFKLVDYVSALERSGVNANELRKWVSNFQSDKTENSNASEEEPSPKKSKRLLDLSTEEDRKSARSKD